MREAQILFACVAVVLVAFCVIVNLWRVAKTEYQIQARLLVLVEAIAFAALSIAFGMLR